MEEGKRSGGVLAMNMNAYVRERKMITYLIIGSRALYPCN
jgi:hypothetical protein